MSIFNHKISYSIEQDPFEPTVKFRHIFVEFDDPFGRRRTLKRTFLANKVEYVKIGGTAMSSATVYPGWVVGFDKNQLIALGNGRIISCVYDREENFQRNDHILIAEHMRNCDGEEFGQFDWLATKRSTDFRLNAIRIILFNANHQEVGYINLDPYLIGQERNGYNRSEY